MSIKTKLITSLGVAFASWLIALPALAADEQFGVTSVITVPGNPLASFDIEFVDPAAGVLLLADRSNKSIDVINTSDNSIFKQLQPGFVGPLASGSPGCPPHVAPVPGANCGGPNGVLTVRHFPGKGRGRALGLTEVWATDGGSKVWVLSLPSGKPVVPPISTALGAPGTDPNRADELCYDPDDGIILVANPNSTPNGFVTFISTHNYKVLGHIVMDGTGGKPNAAGGIEQCQYSPRTGKFYINVPRASLLPTGSGPFYDLVLQIDPVSETISNTLNLTQKSPTDGCVATPGGVRTAVGITGMALGPNHQIAIACGTTAPGSVVITEDFGTFYSLVGEVGTDEIWYNPGDNHYFYATVLKGGAPPPTGQIILGVVDACGDSPPPCVPQVDTVATPTPPGVTPVVPAIGNKTAADPVANQVYVPVNPTNAPLSKICSSHGGDDTKGCIAVFTTTSDDPGE